MPSDCGAGEDSLKSFGQQGDQASQSSGKSPWILIGRTDAEAEAPILWSPDANSQLIGKVPDAGKDRGQKEKRASEDKMAGWHHQCNGHKLGQTSGNGEGLGSQVWCSPWGHEESHMMDDWTTSATWLYKVSTIEKAEERQYFCNISINLML